jgi:hypothetical protein
MSWETWAVDGYIYLVALSLAPLTVSYAESCASISDNGIIGLMVGDDKVAVRRGDLSGRGRGGASSQCVNAIPNLMFDFGHLTVNELQQPV